MKRDPILHELDGLSPELARFKRASREAEAPAGESTDHADQEEAQRIAKLRAGILARTIGEGMDKAHPGSSRPSESPSQSILLGQPMSQSQPTQTTPTHGRLRTLFPRAMAAAAVLAVALVGGWFALRPNTADPCDTILCALDELSDAELAALVGNTITWSSTTDWGMSDTEQLADAAMEAGWLENMTASNVLDEDGMIDAALANSNATIDDWTWQNASLDDLSAMGEGFSDADWDALMLETTSDLSTSTP